ncbi:carboxyl transferase domain-containing protein [Aspergillus foveolatus]|uniref:carboxyl transferase domain-containing protein n=1 Tax=Aspergillus foveolatus TaxID=210207 RepID=UPI003CCD37B4
MVTASTYPVLSSRLDLRAKHLQQNKADWGDILTRFEEALKRVAAEGSEASLNRHQSRGQLLPRDRVALLLDQDTPFLELGAFAGFENPNSTPCANLIAGIGNVSGRPCLLMSHIPTQSGGAWNEMTVLKVNRMMEVAFENDLPLISLVQSAGVFLPQQFRVFHKGGQLFRDLAVRTQHGKPSCAIVFGSSTAGGAYHPALSDYTIFVENQAQAFLGGPPLVKMATGEVIGAEELGGANVHATVTGLADQIAIDEFDAIVKAREWVATLRERAVPPHSLSSPVEPRYPAQDLLSLVNPDIRKPFDMLEVLLRIVDDSRLSVFKPKYGTNMINAWAHILGFPVGIVANQISVINPNEAAKTAQFIRMCNQENTPIIFLHNVTGFMVGAKAEHAGIIKMGAQLVSAVSCSTVPHISIIVGASYGAGNYAMCGRAYKPRFIFTWPTGRCSVMGPDQLSGVMETVQLQSAKSKGKVLEPSQLKKQVESFRQSAARDSECYATSSMLIDDGIIDPRDTRDVLGMCLEVVNLDGVKGTETHQLVHAAPLRPPLYVAPSPLGEDGRPIIKKVLIANRGEIACRVIGTCRKLNIATVAVYVDEDTSSRHIRDADEAINIGSIDRSPRNPFLDGELLIRTALSVNADAIHPGYGYLSENAEFARSIRDAGMIFIGPSDTAMSTLGNKRAAKEYLSKHAPDVPLIPGYAGSSQDAAELSRIAAEIGFPVMLKASAGGGGKGMRIIREAGQLQAELERAQSEAQRSFGSADCILELYVESSKHVELQILGDTHGEVVPFFERDCSVQRRHQKVIEETPCTFLTEKTRQEMSATAVRIAKLIGYENAGTVEFVVDAVTGKFYFLEVNARLQVEHPITEEVTGVDLVSLQLYVAAGGSLRALPALQGLTQHGHAIECRLCAEDPRKNFFPEHGKIHLWLPASGVLGPGRDVRYEAAVQSGSSVSIYFDSMIAKIVVWAPTRALAIEKMVKVLAHTVCAGVQTNQLLMQRCLLHKAFHDPAYTTSFLGLHLDELLHEPVGPIAEIRKSLPIVPAVALRHLASLSTSQKRPFQNVRRRFRNQHHDPVNLQYDVVTMVDWPYNLPETDPTTPLMCVWSPENAGPSATQEAHLLALPESDHSNDARKPAGANARYQQISKVLRDGRVTLSGTRYAVSIESWKPAEGDPALKESWLSSTLEIGINGTKHLAYVSVAINRPEALAGCLNRTQTVFCHIPAIGASVVFKRDTSLSFVESTRAAASGGNNQEQRTVTAPMPCKVLSTLKKNGEQVKSGDIVMVIESMKMEVTISASADGQFETNWKEGDAVEEGKTLCTVK